MAAYLMSKELSLAPCQVEQDRGHSSLPWRTFIGNPDE